MTESKIKIIGIDKNSKTRGVGRYVQALQEIVNNISVNDKNIIINPFFSVSGARLNPAIKNNKKSKHIAVIHDLIPLKYPEAFPLGILGRIRLKLNTRSIRFYDFFVTDSHSSAADIQNILNVEKDRTLVVYPFSPLTTESYMKNSRPVSLPGSVNKNSFALYVGDVNWHKNIVNLAESCLQANITLVCVGKAFEMLYGKIPEHKEYAQIKAFKKIYESNKDKIIIMGYVDDTSLAWLYENALVNMLISQDEGFGYSYIEASHFGTPSILSDIAIFREISGSKGAFFVNQNSVQSISQQLVRIKNSPEERCEAGKDAKIRSIFFSKEKFADDWKKVIEKLIFFKIVQIKQMHYLW